MKQWRAKLKSSVSQVNWRWVGAAALGLLLLNYVWYRYNLLPVSSDKSEVGFTVAAGERPPLTAQRLQRAKLIRSDWAFMLYLTLHGWRSQIRAGDYLLQPSQSSSQIAKTLVGGRVQRNLLVVPEGSTVKEIGERAAKRGVAESEFNTALAARYEYDFLATKPANVGLEGYLFPDSYQVRSTTGASALVRTMLDNFGRKLTDEHVAGFARLGLNLHQGITLASIVEQEVADPEDRRKVAQVFLKRLRIGQALESDPTTQYAADLLGKPFDLKLASPYNTYHQRGLPPGPICNPGLDAIAATIDPAKTDYLYFVSADDGTTYFAKTFDEHQRNVAKYRR